MMKPYLYLTLLFIGLVVNCEEFVSTVELNQYSYISPLDNSERKYYVYLPEGYYSQETKKLTLKMNQSC